MVNSLKECERLQLHIQLLDVKPKIWRRFIVESTLSFERLHRAIQAVMGWENRHLFEFELSKNLSIMPGDPNGGLPFGPLGGKTVRSPKNNMLYDFIQQEKLTFDYIYDMGDYWEHRIKVEKILPYDPEAVVPICIAGENACPPEDCGGTPGLEQLMEIRSNPDHPQYQRMIVGWLGEDYDPAFFDINRVNKKLTRMKSRHDY